MTTTAIPIASNFDTEARARALHAYFTFGVHANWVTVTPATRRKYLGLAERSLRTTRTLRSYFTQPTPAHLEAEAVILHSNFAVKTEEWEDATAEMRAHFFNLALGLERLRNRPRKWPSLYWM